MPDNMNITDAQYTQIMPGENAGIKATINGVVTFVPISEDNGHYAEIMRQVSAGELTIADAE